MDVSDARADEKWHREAGRLIRGDAVVIVTSPKAGSGLGRERIGGLRDRLERQGMRVSVLSEIPLVIDHIHRAPGSVVVVAAGGDGTLNLVASEVPRGVPVVPFPLGTENLVARYYGLLRRGGSMDLELAVATVVEGRDHWIDAGIATFARPRWSEPRSRLFLVMASVGFDAEVVRRMHLARTGHIRRWSYWKPIVAMLRKYRYPLISVERIDEVSGSVNEAAPLTVAWALVFNLPRYAGGLAIEADADESDGLLDFCGLCRGSHLHGVRYLLGVLSGRHRRWADVARSRGEAFRMTCERPLAVQLDGDYAGRLPVEVRVDPARVLLRLPRGMAG